ncbi:nucleotidyl transferase AbiEii/AbiGii toxin family protein [Dactylosporangium sp. NPDC051541]|uniref:nucleotidyl transferase AbiEii/AbiGii toxin family protein n=1 Tax=Dactylosporangium sp. NPDC051541 TaxID=3363977 RepID=UPI00378BD114
MTEPFPYASPAALRAALTDRLKKLASGSAFTATDLQRQFAYDRLLTRVFSAPDADRWVLKGATALLARLDLARHSKDIDLSWQSTTDLDEAEQALRTAAGQNAGDFFSFEIRPPTPLVGDKGRRFAVVAVLGGRPFASFSVDLVAGHSMTHPPEAVSPLVQVEIPGLLRVSYRAYPLVDHIADKVTACLETHARSDGAVSVSTRYKDLVDLVLIAHTQRPVAADLRRALLSETARRGVGLPIDFTAPGPLWPAGYEAKATELPQLLELGRFPAALALVKAMLDPVLDGMAAGRWDPVRAAWVA